MKKKMAYLLLVSILVFSMTGCKSAKLENGQDLVVQLDGYNVTADDLYKEYKNTAGVETLVNMINSDLLNRKYKTTEDMTSEAESQVEYLENYLGDEFDAGIKYYYGVSNKEELKEHLITQSKTSELTNDYITSEINDDELEEYYEDTFVAAKHILIKVDDTEDEQKLEDALNKAKEVIEKLKDGESWDELVNEYSDDSHEDGGDLGTFGEGAMVEEFYNGVLDTEIGSYTTTPVLSQYGYHIIFRTEPDSFEDVKEDVKETLIEAKLASNPELAIKAIIELHKEYNISWEDSDLKSAYNDYMDDLYETAKTDE